EEEILTAAVVLIESETPHQKRGVFEECLIKEEDPKYEPLSDQNRSNKPRNKNKKKWSTLGEPSGKWDYYVRYDIIQPTPPIKEVAATGWGDEFEDDENHNPITKIIVPEQDDKTYSSEIEWKNPFATKHGGQELELPELELLELLYPQFKREVKKILANESCLYLDEDEELPYPKFKEKILANESCLHLNEEEELPYPKFKREVERIMANEVAYLVLRL
ncbi:hypothetical protein Tco_0207316, partial [Tanacetum coccineum]